MEKLPVDFSFYTGKVGVYNFLLIAVGVLFLVLYVLKRQETHYERLSLYYHAGLFFVLYGFLFDAYRIKALRKYLLWNYSFSPYKTIILVVTLLPLYSDLIESIVRILSKRHSEKIHSTKNSSDS